MNVSRETSIPKETEMDKRNNILITDDMRKYLEKVLEANESINLTRVTDNQDAILLHLEDSLAVLEEFSKAPDGLYGDLGSGGGFPGVPLALATGRKTILIDSVKKKMTTVSTILASMNLDDLISTNDLRIEELAHEMPEAFSVLTARALTSLPSLLELASPLLKQGGQLIALKSKEENKFDNPSLENKLGMRCVSKRDYYLSDDESYRTVYVFEKYKQPEVTLPRRVGMAQKRPYK